MSTCNKTDGFANLFPSSNLEPPEYDRVARELHSYYSLERNKQFPYMWEHYGLPTNIDKLVTIFGLFYSLQDISSEANESHIKELLHKNLQDRWDGKSMTDYELDVRLISLYSGYQIDIFKSYGIDVNNSSEYPRTILPAFDLFASGVLSMDRRQIDMHGNDFNRLGVLGNESAAVSNVMRHRTHYPEPDGGAFFYWAEFAFLALSIDSDRNFWLKMIPILLRAEVIARECYGYPIDSNDRRNITFKSYDISDTNEIKYRFRPLTSKVFKALPDYNGRTVSELHKVAYECARSAFPKGVEDYPKKNG